METSPRTRSWKSTRPSPMRKRMTGDWIVGPPLAPLVRGQVGAPPDVVRRLVGGLLGGPVGGQLLGRAEALVGLVLAEQPLRGRPGTSRGAASADTARTRPARRGRRWPGPRPSRCPASAARRGCRARSSTVERATSVSSSRRMNVPPWRRANRMLNSAVRAVPMCSGPVGLGAIRQRMVMPASVPEGAVRPAPRSHQRRRGASGAGTGTPAPSVTGCRRGASLVAPRPRPMRAGCGVWRDRAVGPRGRSTRRASAAASWRASAPVTTWVPR